MNKKQRHKLNNHGDKAQRFYFSIFLFSVVIVAGLLIFSFSNENRIAQNNKEYLRDNTESAAKTLNEVLSEGYDNIRVIAAFTEQSLKSPEVDVAGLQNLIKNSVFDFMEFADKDGNDHNIMGSVSDARDREYYIEGMKGNVGMELIYESRATHETLLMYYSPVHYDGETIGSVVGVYQASNRINQLLKSDLFGKNVETYLVNDDGRIIAADSGISPENEVYIGDRISIADEDKELLSEILRNEGHGSIRLQNNRVGAYIEYLSSTGWYLVQVFPEGANSFITSVANKQVNKLIVFLLVMFVMISISIMLFFKDKQDQIKAANEAKTTFLFNMSHDIRTPMNAITGYTNMAIRDIDDKAKVNDNLLKIQKAGNILLDLINDVLDMSRIESGKIVISAEKCDVTQSFMGIQTMLTELANASDLEISFECKNISKSMIYADISHVERILVNLISNAIKYTPEGGTVSVSVEELPYNDAEFGLYRYVIKDTGIGMSEEFVERCFENFAREENTTTSGIQGTGLGLPIAKSLTELMGGRITCESIEGEGTTFMVELPFRLQMNEEAGTEECKENELCEMCFEGLNVLLVDDNDFNREIASDILSDEGMHVFQAESGRDAIEMVKAHEPDYYSIIFMDVQMPFMDGYETTQIIRETYPDYHIPIIALSANAFDTDKQKSREAGMDGHVAKPIDIDILIKTMNEVMGTGKPNNS